MYMYGCVCSCAQLLINPQLTSTDIYSAYSTFHPKHVISDIGQPIILFMLRSFALPIDFYPTPMPKLSNTPGLVSYVTQFTAHYQSLPAPIVTCENVRMLPDIIPPATSRLSALSRTLSAFHVHNIPAPTYIHSKHKRASKVLMRLPRICASLYRTYQTSNPIGVSSAKERTTTTTERTSPTIFGLRTSAAFALCALSSACFFSFKCEC